MSENHHITGRQIAAALALARMSQADLAKASNVSVPTLGRMIASEGPAVGMANNVAAVRAALEAAGIEFTNGGQPGVRLKGCQPMITTPRIASSSTLSVRLNSGSAEGPIVIVVERAAIDDYFGLRASSPEERRKIVAKNLEAITRIANDRYVRRIFSIGQTANAQHLQIVLRLEDLKKENLVPPSSNGGSSIVHLPDEE